jgi:tetratricopeptide (TPR) repeat protein
VKPALARRLLGAAFLVSVLLLAVCKVEDTDTFYHLALGRLFWALKGFPASEPFAWGPVAAGRFHHPSWLFSLGAYGAWGLGGWSGLVLAKASVVATGFLFLLLDATRLRGRRTVAVAACVLTVAALLARYRFVERPDVVAFAILAFTTWALARHVAAGRGSRAVWLLPFTTLLWANVQTSVVLLPVPFVAVAAGAVAQRWMHRRGLSEADGPDLSRLKVLGIVLGLCLVAAVVSPSRGMQLVLGGQVLGGGWFRQEVAELAAPTWRRQPAAFAVPLAVLAAFALNRRRLEAADLLLVLPFWALNFSAQRFLTFSLCVSAPVLARNLSGFLGSVELRPSSRTRMERLAWWGAFAVVVAAPVAAIARVPGLSPREKFFGLGADFSQVPDGGLRYLEGIGFRGRVYNPFHFGGYVEWRDFPRMQPIADGRIGLPPDLLESQVTFRGVASVVDALHARFGFEAAVLDYPRLPTGASDAAGGLDLGLVHPGWALVYWDDVCLVYLRRDGPYASAVTRDGYRAARPVNDAGGLSSRDPALLERELLRAARESGASRAWSLLGALYNETGRPVEALEAFSRVRDQVTVDFPGVELGTGIALESLGRLPEAREAYRAAVRRSPDAAAWFRLGGVARRLGSRSEAIEAYGKAIEARPGLLSAYGPLAELHRADGKPERARAVDERLRSEVPRLQGEGHFQAGVAAYLARRPEEARREFQLSLRVNPASASAASNLGFVELDGGNAQEAIRWQLRALDLDPGLANAHYGLALAYRLLGSGAMERRHFEEYLRLEPTGHYARMAREALRALAEGPR